MIEIPHLDLNIARHCNMRCVACSHFSPWVKPWFMTMETIERDLLALKPILKPFSINLVGGEPTLHKELVEIMRLVTQLRIDSRHIVITNGKLLPKMPEEFWASLEGLKISIYASLDPEVLKLCEAYEAKYKFHLASELFPEFYLQTDDVPDGASFHDCPWKTDCYTVHDGYFYLCPQSAFGSVPLVDGLPLTGITEDKLKAFMERKEPLNACRTCRAYTQKTPWREAKSKEEWLAASHVQR